MSKKRRMFDIELPEEDTVETFSAEKVSPPAKAKAEARRGPMATAISENADSLRDREALVARIRAENDALAHEHVRLKQQGLIVDLIPLDQIETRKLTRDRHTGVDEELEELVSSIRDVGLSNPIRVEQRADGRYELIQGFRRIQAFTQLLAETGDAEAYGKIPAGIMARGAELDVLYRRMVDENLVRKDISLAEMAQLAIEYAADPMTDVTDPDKAVAKLYKSASYSKRSYIRSFIPVVKGLGETLQFIHEVPRALGLALAAKIDAIPGFVAAVQAELEGWGNRTVEDELAVLRRFAGDETAPKTASKRPDRPAAEAKAKTSFQIARPEGAAKCVAGAGRLEIRLDRDFSTIDRRKLEAAVRGLLDQIS
ncbi:ParB/RepB/Spo0J family partition protein [Pseudorhodobacter aquimaris]|uniref:ParB/RepB/Spo0J family partition protein n=1 Tax=Pseudorhodobacter aquimaris TaxID=687412 RepID=UPI00067B4742|nr:ParB N-terminal domain-containing protein [Pseudorhodobacter aquimaris]